MTVPRADVTSTATPRYDALPDADKAVVEYYVGRIPENLARAQNAAPHLHAPTQSAPQELAAAREEYASHLEANGNAADHLRAIYHASLAARER